MNTNAAVTPVETLSGRIGARLCPSQIIFCEPPTLEMRAIPEFPGSRAGLEETDIVWDVFALLDSIRRPGAWALLTCSCGDSTHADLHELVLVSHPDASTVIWELDVAGLRPALDARFDAHEAGFVRLVFERRNYEADILALVHALQPRVAAPVPVEELPAELMNADVLRREQPGLRGLQVDTLEPDIGGLTVERLLEIDAQVLPRREPLWPPGTLLEFGFFPLGDGHRLVRIAGEVAWRHWPGQDFTRWEALAAFRAWVDLTEHASLLPASARPEGRGLNGRVLRRESDRAACHAAGRRLAEVMQACLEEGETAPGVSVRYCESPLEVVRSEAG